ncbi:arsenate reductase ArsC [Candidatus Poribacteria bacterium]|nr:arsenate reductase ArsC [Candidatus Poribacteria bacterium]
MKKKKPSSERIYRVLFLCTGNSARSIIAESLLNHNSDGRFVGYSAGSHPRGEVHPYALELLLHLGHDTENLRSKSWDEFEEADAPVMDFVFTVCDNAANETCPVWPGRPVTAHWGLADPAGAQGTEDEQREAFAEAYELLERRVKAFLSLSFESLEGQELENKLREIGHLAS